MRIRILIAAILAVAIPVSTPAADTDPFGFSEADYSAWGITGADYPYDPAAAGAPNGFGCFPVGNGLVFAHLGVDGDFNTLRGITGPGYQTRNAEGKAEYWQPGSWPDMRPRVMQQASGGELVPLPDWSSQSIQQVRGAALVRTVQRSHGIDLFTLTYAVPGRALLIQEFVLFAGPELTPVVSLPLPGAGINEHNQPYLMNGGQRLTISALGLQQAAGDQLEGSMLIPIFQEGETSLDIQLVRTGDPSRPVYRGAIRYRFAAAEWVLPEVDKTAIPFAEQTYQYWQDWSAGNRVFDTGDVRLDDLLTQLPVMIETQRDAYSGGVAPMVSYHGYWVRDSLGPLLCDLDNGRFNEVLRLLRYHRAACLHYGQCHMLVPLDLDLSSLDGWLPGQPGSVGCLSYIGTEREDWVGVGVESAEVPSLIVIQHYLVWRAMHLAGEGAAADAFISEAWSFITHNLLAMQYDPDYGVKFHGDETYTHGALYSTYDRPESGAIGYPNGYIPTDFFSADNTMLHRAAASVWEDMALSVIDVSGENAAVNADLEQAMRILDDMTRILETQYFGPYSPGCMAVSPVSRERWLAPFANIALRPGWLGLPYGPPLEAGYWQAAKDALWQEPYPLTTPHSGYMTGHGLGYWLDAATRNGDLYTADRTVEMLLSAASPEGGWCEVLSPAGLPVDIYGRANRIRPWESGVNYHAIVEYLDRDGPWLYFDPAGQAWEPEPLLNLSRAAPYPFTRVLALTTDPGFRDRLAQDQRFSDAPPETIHAWDAGMPFTVSDLRQALLGEEEIAGTLLDDLLEGLLIPYLYFDEGVRDGLSRRTFKDEEFWNGAEMTELLADYEAAGGVVLTPETLEYQLAEDEVVALKMLVVLCTDTFTHQMPPAEVANFHHEVAQWINWYDEVAGDALRLELDYLQIDQHLSAEMCGPMGGGVYWMSYEDARQLLQDRGIEDGVYDSVAFFWAWGREHELPDGTMARQAYGGAAQGPADDMAFLGAAGKTSYFGSAVLADKPGGPSKTALHEYLHNVDAMFEYVGDERLFHPDHMSRNMETLLAEVPSGFEKWGYTDDEVCEMVAAELRNEIHFPWPTQLVYYEQALRRIPRADYAALLKNFGRRDTGKPREALYEHCILPIGTEHYQVFFEPVEALPEVQVAEYDFVNPEHLLWTNTLWAGPLPPDSGQPACVYSELTLLSDDVIEHVIGAGDGTLSVEVRDTADGAEYSAAEVMAVINGERLAMQSDDGGVYTCPLPEGLSARNSVEFQATAPGYVCTPLSVDLVVRPAWELSVEPAVNDQGQPVLDIGLDGPEGEYKLTVEATSSFNTVQQLLSDAGLLQPVEVYCEIGAAAGYHSQFTTGVDAVTLQACSMSITVDYTGADGATARYVHEYPATVNASTLITGVPEEDLPDCVLQAYPVIPGVDEERRGRPGLELTSANGHVSGGTIAGDADAAAYLDFGYNDAGLVVSGMILDDVRPANGTWDSDRINLVFDAELNTTLQSYPDGPVGHSSWERDDYWVFLLPFQPDGPQTMRLGGEKPSGGVGYYGSVEGAEAVVEPAEGGYSFRWTIPWDELPYLDQPEPGKLIGFTVFLSDYDESLTELMYLTDWGGADGIEWRFWDTGLLYFTE